MDYLSCTFEPATYLIIAEEVAPLIYYSHFVAIIAAILISSLVFLHNPKLLVSRLFLAFAFVFSTWAFLNVVLWATNDPGLVMFSWSMQILAEPVMYAIAFYLFYILVNRKLPSFRQNSLVALVLAPLVIFLPTTLTLGAVELSFCEAEEGLLAMYYTYFLNLTFILLIVYTGIRGIPSLKHNSDQRKSAIFFVFGLITFLLSFSAANLISSFTDNWLISQYGLFGMPIFAILVAYSIVQFKAFRINVAGTQILIVVLLTLVASLLVIKQEYRIAITALTLIFTTVAGLLLIRSVNKEIKQREELQILTKKLEKANVRLKTLDKQKSEFVLIASHQLRSPLTSIRGYASMLSEGSFGSIPEKAKEPLERIETSAKRMALAVEDYLNVSRIESGNMKYELADFNLKDEIEQICDDVRPTALKAGLVLLFQTNLQSKAIVHADVGKTVQMAHNLINNSIKYTKRGTITVFVRDDLTKKQVFVDVIDTGMGMSQDTIDILFQKFSRADGANKVNTTGTGLGLFVAHKMAEAMGGDITAHSEGEGKGSRFTLTLPLAM